MTSERVKGDDSTVIKILTSYNNLDVQRHTPHYTREDVKHNETNGYITITHTKIFNKRNIYTLKSEGDF